MSAPASPHSAPARPGRLQRIRVALLGRRAGKTAGDRGEDWSPDDMAECVHDGDWFNFRGERFDGLAKGHVAIVKGVRMSPDPFGQYRLYLILARWPAAQFDARGFRKLTPRADAARAADAAFTRKLKQGRVRAPSLASRLADRLERILS